MSRLDTEQRWQKEAGARVDSSRPLDSDKLQSPCIVRNPTGGFRIFYTAIGPAKPYSACQGYILSAVSDDGLVFRKEPGIRLAPDVTLPHISLRVLAPTITECGDGRWRMYVESRGLSSQPTVICSAISSDMLHWEWEDGIRLQTSGGVGGPRYLPLPDGRGRLYCFESKFDPQGLEGGYKITQSVISAVSSDGLCFEIEQGYRLRDRQTAYDTAGITAAEVIPPKDTNGKWTMVYSAWQDAPSGSIVPAHPSHNLNMSKSSFNEDFAAASIATDMTGYRSRIFTAYSTDGLQWERGECAIDGGGYDLDGLDAVHAEDMSLIEMGKGMYRMYYAACDKHGKWWIASAITCLHSHFAPLCEGNYT